VTSGGLLAGIGIGELTGLEDGRDWMPELFGGENAILLNNSGSPENIAELQKNVFDPLTEFLNSRGVNVPDGKIDGIYTASRGDGLLILDYTGSPEPKEREFVLPNGEIRSLSTADSAIYELE